MSVLEDCQRFVLSEFNGAKPLLDAEDLAPGDALVALNCKFASGKVWTREGFASYLALGATFSACPYYYAQGNTGATTEYMAFVQYVSGSGSLRIRVYNLDGISGLTDIYTAFIASGLTNYPQAVYASVGPRLYAVLTHFDASLVATRIPLVWDGNTANTMLATFQRPMKTTEVTEALTQPAAGVITAGTHYVGVLFQTKAGYWTKPGPANSTTLDLVPQSIVSTGTNNIRVTLTPATTWPAWISKVQVIMTTVGNSFQYYLVPGTITSVTSGSSTVYTIDLNISDLQLTSLGSQGAGTVADDYFALLAMNASDVQPFAAKGVVAWGQRLVWVGNYGGTDSLFPSEPLNPEWITADQHILQLPGGKPIGSVFVMRGVLYAISSAGGLYSWVDNGGRPVAFSPPTTVDEKVMCAGFYCTTVASSGGYALIASPQGLYAFSGGAFPSTAISRLQDPTYDTLIWTNTQEEVTQVLDFPSERIILLRSGVRPSGLPKIFVWDYSKGMTPDKVKFNTWTVTGLTQVRPAMCIARISGIWQLISGNIDTFYRQRSVQANDSGSDLYTDFTVTGIDWQYQTAPLPSGGDSPILQHLAGRLRAKALTGTPGLYVSGKALDDARTITMPISPITLATAPGKEYLALFDAQEERISYLFTNNAVAGAGIEIARLTHFYDFFAENR